MAGGKVTADAREIILQMREKGAAVNVKLLLLAPKLVLLPHLSMIVGCSDAYMLLSCPSQALGMYALGEDIDEFNEHAPMILRRIQASRRTAAPAMIVHVGYSRRQEKAKGQVYASGHDFAPRPF